MTREEKLNKAAFDYVDQGGTTAEWSDEWEDYSDAEYIEQAFKAGAEWEHKMLVEKACEWIDDVDISKYLSCIFSGAVNISFISDDFIRDFKKEMEE